MIIDQGVWGKEGSRCSSFYRGKQNLIVDSRLWTREREAEFDDGLTEWEGTVPDPGKRG